VRHFIPILYLIVSLLLLTKSFMKDKLENMNTFNNLVLLCLRLMFFSKGTHFRFLQQDKADYRKAVDQKQQDLLFGRRPFYQFSDHRRVVKKVWEVECDPL